mmetsp:Transcript_6527/g.12906  ORF Transcript_6527/g.12906 Transcript_6527/m.12906 type:complete len:212 (-) Transcript_6527:234-869(-)
MSHCPVAGVPPEEVLLAVGQTEDGVAGKIEDADQDNRDDPQIVGSVHEDPGLEGVREGDPTEISECEHETKTVCCDVHCCQHGRFMIQGVPHVHSLKQIHQHHPSAQSSQSCPLLHSHAQIQNDPPDQTWSQFTKEFPVKIATRPRVQFPPHEEVSQNGSRCTGTRQKGPLPERAQIQNKGHQIAPCPRDKNQREVKVVEQIQRESVEGYD